MKQTLGLLLVVSLVCLPLMAQEAAPVATAQDEALPTVDQILNKLVEASGGKAALEKFTTRVSKGTFEIPEMGASGTIVIYAKAPNKMALQIEVEGFGTVKQGFDGTVAWEDNPMAGLVERSGAALAAARRESVFNRELVLKGQYKKLEVKGKQKVDDRDAYVVEATPEEGAVETWYFDAATGLLARIDAERESDQGVTPVENHLRDYRDVDGVKIPFSMENVLPAMTIKTTLEEVKHNVEIDDSLFTKPTM